MFETWSVGVAIRATSNIARLMSSGAQATGIANRSIERQNALLGINANRQKFLSAQVKIFGGVAGGMALGIGLGIKQASNLQQAMVAVGIATETSGKQLQSFQSLAMKMSGVTAQSIGTIAQEMAAAATAGLNKPSQLTKAFPTMAKAADVMWLSPKHINPVEAIAEMSTLSHLFGSYQGPAFAKMITRATQMMFVQPEALKSFITQGRQFIPTALASGVSQEDIFRQAMTMGQTGFLKSRGGSGLARVIEFLSGAATVTGHLSKIQHAAMHSLGLTNRSGVLDPGFRDKGGNLLLQKAVDHLEHIRKAFAPTDFGNLLSNAFMSQGGRYLKAILLPSVYEKSVRNWKTLTSLGSVESMWKKYTDTFTFGIQNFLTNGQNLLGSIFLPILPSLTSGLKAAGAAMGALSQYLMKHPKIAATIAIAAFTGTVAFALAAARAIWQLNDAMLATGLASKAALAGQEAGALGGLARGGVGLAGLGIPASVFPIALGVAAVATLGYGALQAARHFPPLNDGINRTILGLANMPGPLHNFGLSLAGAARSLGILHHGSPLDNGNILDKNGHYKGILAKHQSMQAAPPPYGFWSDLWNQTGAKLQTGMKNSDGSMPPVLSQAIGNGAASMITHWFADFTQATPGIVTSAESAVLQRIYDRQNAAGRSKPTVHVEHLHVGVHPGTTPEHAKKVANVVWAELLNSAKAHSDTTSIHFAITPNHPGPAFGSA